MKIVSGISVWLLIFLTYSFIGWFFEVAASLVLAKKWSNRGFLIGPLCPIYGFGAMILTMLLRRADNLVEVFLVSVLASAVLEYMTSFVMEKLFRVRWWDYSEKPFNLHGRISLENLFYFGIMGVLVVYCINPILTTIYGSIPEHLVIILASAMLVLVLIDLAISLWLIIGCRVTVGTIQVDATDEITENIHKLLMEKGRLNRRLAKAFPNMKPKKKAVSKSKKTVNKTSNTKKSTSSTQRSKI